MRRGKHVVGLVGAEQAAAVRTAGHDRSVVGFALSYVDLVFRQVKQGEPSGRLSARR